MTTETTTEASKPERFALDREAATAWLTQAVKAFEECAIPATDDAGRELPEIGEGYRPADDWDGGSATGALVSGAQEVGAISGPCEITWDYDYSQYGDHGYTWCLRLGQLNLRTLFEELKRCGDGGEEPGIPAALAVLREAVNAGNDLLGDLALYVESRAFEVLNALHDAADDYEDETVSELARKSGLIWQCQAIHPGHGSECLWDNAASDHECGGCGQPRQEGTR